MDTNTASGADEETRTCLSKHIHKLLILPTVLYINTSSSNECQLIWCLSSYLFFCPLYLMTWTPHWHSLQPSQTGSDAGHCVSPPHWPSPRCCCEAPASGVSERGGALTCWLSRFSQSWRGKQRGAAVWARHWSGHSVLLRVAGGDSPRWSGSSGRHCEVASSRRWCEGWPSTPPRAKQKPHGHGRCTMHGAVECNRPHRSSARVKDQQLITCGLLEAERQITEWQEVRRLHYFDMINLFPAFWLLLSSWGWKWPGSNQFETPVLDMLVEFL